jgi:cystathionine gamma-synthase
MLQAAGGAVPSPFDCWLLSRGVRTMALRVPAQVAGAQRVAEALMGVPGVEQVLYPGLPGHPGHALASRQMRGFGGLLSFIVAGGREAALGFAGRLRLIRRATSLGAVESNVDHRESVEPVGFGTPPGLLRLSVGIEHPDDLIDDLTQAARSR